MLKKIGRRCAPLAACYNCTFAEAQHGPQSSARPTRNSRQPRSDNMRFPLMRIARRVPTTAMVILVLLKRIDIKRFTREARNF